MADVISILTAAVTTVQKLRELAKKIKDAETSNLIADLAMDLADLKMQFALLQEENMRLSAEIQKARDQSDARRKVVLRNRLYHLTESMDGRPEGPYCTHCLDAEDKLILVVDVQGSASMLGNHMCPRCKTYYR